MQAARNFIINRQYAQALHVLSDMDAKNAEWYYYSALANAGNGNRIMAMNHAAEAVRLEPNNQEYQSLLSQFQQGSFSYQQRGNRYGYSMEGAGRTIMQLCLAQAACMFCCRPC